MEMNLKKEIMKRDELLVGYQKQIGIQEKFIRQQKEMIRIKEINNRKSA